MHTDIIRRLLKRASTHRPDHHLWLLYVVVLDLALLDAIFNVFFAGWADTLLNRFLNVSLYIFSYRFDT